METATFWDCIWETWAETWKSVSRRPSAVVIALAVLLVANFALVALDHMHGPIPLTSASRLLRSVLGLAKSAVTLALPVQVIQQIMLGEHKFRVGSVFGREFWRYLLLGTIIGLAFCAVAFVVIGGSFLVLHASGFGHGGTRLPLVLLSLVVFCLMMFVATRLSLLFCHVALGGTMRWRASWMDTRGYFWRIVISHFLTALPIQICAGCLLFLGGTASRAMGMEVQSYLFAIAYSLYVVVGMTVGAACSCWLYRRFAKTLLNRS